MKELKVAIIQADLVWENVDENLKRFTQKINELESNIDLIVLPEMFSTGFSMNPEKYFEPMQGKSMTWMAEMARTKNCVITGSLIIKDNNQYYNRLLWMRPDSTYTCYDKRHLFRMQNEHEHYSMGLERIVIELNGWRICPIICYDLRFPVWSRNRNDYDLLICVANWPQARNFAWKSLLVARAIENQCFVVGVNRVGNNDKGVPFSGDSVIIHPLGNSIVTTNPSEEAVAVATLNGNELVKLRESFPAYLDADRFTIDNS